MDWNDAFSDRSPRSHSLYEYRQRDAGLPVDYRLRISRHGISLPRAILQGQHLSLVLDELFAPVLGINDFNQLPIPFRAVASDLVTGEEVVMDRGSLSTAVRASMSIPGLFEPVVYDGRMLVDGGIADNIPVDALNGMHLDRIIVVDVGSPRLQMEDIQSVGNVMTQLTALLVRNNSEQQLKKLRSQDVLITPQLGQVSNSDFTEVDAAVAAGYKAALAALAQATPSLHGDADNGAPVTASQTMPETPHVETRPRIDFIEVQNSGPVSDKVVRAMLRQKLGTPFDPLQMRDDISHIYALDYFSSIRYQLVRRGEETGVRLVCAERGTSNTSLQIGLQLADDFRGNATFGLSAGLRAAGLNAYGGTAYVYANAGSRPQLEARFFQPLDTHLRFFVEPLLGYRADQIEIFPGNDTTLNPITSFQRRETYTGLDLGMGLFRQRGEARFGWHATDGDVSYRSGLPLRGENYEDGYLMARLGWDTYDDLAFPQNGERARIERQVHRHRYHADVNYDRDEIDLGIARHLGAVAMIVEAKADLSADRPGDEGVVPLGGFLALSGLPPDSIWGNQRALLRTVVTVPLKRNPVMESLPVYMGVSYERGNVWFDRDEVDWASMREAGSLFVGARTPLGPAYLSFGVAQGAQRSLNLYFGHVFR